MSSVTKACLPENAKKVFLFLEKCSKISGNGTGSWKAPCAYPDPGGMPCGGMDRRAGIVWDILRAVDGVRVAAQRRTGDGYLSGRPCRGGPACPASAASAGTGPVSGAARAAYR